MKNPGIGSPYCKRCGHSITQGGLVLKRIDSMLVCCSSATYDDGTFNAGYCMSCCPNHEGRDDMEEAQKDHLDLARRHAKQARTIAQGRGGANAVENAAIAQSHALIDIADSLRELVQNGIKTYPEGP